MEERKSSPSLTPPPEYIPQPDHFYTSGGEPKWNSSRNLRPEDDTNASRGIPVFKPSLYEFCDFEKYMEAIQPWGMRSGIVKVIPPKEWKHGLPDNKPMLEDIRIRHPIEQNMVGISGLFRQQNIEKRRVYSLREWFELGMSDDFRTPGAEEVRRDLKRGTAGTGRKLRAKREVAGPSEASASPAPPMMFLSNDQVANVATAEGGVNPDQSMESGAREDSLGASVVNSPQSESIPLDAPPQTSGPVSHHQRMSAAIGSAPSTSYPIRDTDVMGASTSTSTLTTGAPSTSQPTEGSNVPDAAAAQKAALARQKKAARAALKTDLDANFLASFDPATSWLPPGSSEADYLSPEFIAGLERLYWRGCGVGKAAMYGADMPGSLFTKNTGSSLASTSASAQLKKHKGLGLDGPVPWDVSNLPSALTRLLPRGMKIPGVNTPYLYFGMWRATFAWHVEDMDLFSINYIHWGAPKHWYAVPQARANALEGVMKQFFPSDKNGCPQFLRHKSYLASPTALRSASVKPNTLVQNAGEFVITYPRGYHAGFNAGLNCAESVNFALNSWLDLGRKARFCHCVSDSVRIDVDALLAEKARIEAEEMAGIRRPQAEPRQAAIRPALPPQAYMAPPQKPKKRKLQEIQHLQLFQSHQQTNPGNFKQPHRPYEKKAIEPPPAKRVHREVDVKLVPCCLCTSPSETDLLPVNDPPFPHMGVPTPRTADGTASWKAHEKCAMTIPETWVDEIDGEKRVFGVDAIVKDRWNLRCSACVTFEDKAHGAPIQCAKGKCSKALHVNCAEQGKGNSTYRIVEIQENQVLITLDAAAALPTASTCQAQDDSASLIAVNGATDGATHRVLKTIKKYSVEVLCGLHNPASVQAKRNAKAQRLHAALLAIPAGGRIRVKFSTGVYECTLLQINEAEETVQVAWSEGGTKMFNWNKIAFGGWSVDTAQPTAFSTVFASGPPQQGYLPAQRPQALRDYPVASAHQTSALPHFPGMHVLIPSHMVPGGASHGDRSLTSLPLDARHQAYPTQRYNFGSPVNVSTLPQNAKEMQSVPALSETTLTLPAISPDSSNPDMSMTG